MSGQLERIPKTSPLLRGAVIERDYTKGIEAQLGAGQQSNPQPQPEAQQVTPVQEPIKTEAQTQTPQPEFTQSSNSGFEAPKGFSFDEEVPDQSDTTEEDANAGFELAPSSAKSFSNVTGDLIKIYAPKIAYTRCAIDINNVELHINKGNIHPSAREFVVKFNENATEALTPSDDVMKMWKKAFANYLEKENVGIANHKTELAIATIALTGEIVNATIQIKRQGNKSLNQLISSYNPSFFDSQDAKTGTPPKEEEVKENKTEKTPV